MTYRTLTLAVLLGASCPALAEPPPLIPREILFGNPERSSPQLSPDGKHIAYLRPDDKNVLQVWVRTTVPAKGEENDRAVTADPKRGIRQFFWAYDNKHILYLQDDDGDENFHLHAVNIEDKKDRDLTPHKGVRVQGVELSRKFPTQILAGMNKRNKAMFDMHRIDLVTGEDKLDTENPGNVMGWAADAEFQVRGATAVDLKDGGFDLMVREKAGAEWKKVLDLTALEQGQAAGFGQDRNTLYVVSNHGAANTLRLLKLNLENGKEELIAEDPEYDISAAMIDDEKRIPQAVAFTKARTEWKVLDDTIKADFAKLAKVQRGDFSVSSRTTDDALWIVSYRSDDAPAVYYLYDRKAKEANLLFSSHAKLAEAKLARTEPVEYKAKDGLLIRGYLTKPLGVEAKGLPTVLLVHGGPWARDNWGMSPMVQWLANRGYVVFQVNYRGSTGYGKKFHNAGNKEWAGKMHQDLIDGVEWLVKQGVAGPKKVAIMGGSYGGYATLVGLTFTPEVFCCGVDIVGPSNISTLLKTIPPYWTPMKKQFDVRVGSLETEEELLKERSPLFKVDKITKPLLIGQGKNDPRVKEAESEQIVKAMRDKGKEVTYVLYPDEGHGFVRPENRLHFFGITEEFLAKHLGGRKEPAGEVKGATGVKK